MGRVGKGVAVGFGEGVCAGFGVAFGVGVAVITRFRLTTCAELVVPKLKPKLTIVKVRISAIFVCLIFITFYFYGKAENVQFSIEKKGC